MHTDHCPDCFAALEETESGDYGCPSHGHIEEAFWLTADEVATQARELHENNEAYRARQRTVAGRVTSLMAAGLELPAEVLTLLSELASDEPISGAIAMGPKKIATCVICEARLGEQHDGNGGDACCPVCLPLAFPHFVVGGAA